MTVSTSRRGQARAGRAELNELIALFMSGEFVSVDDFLGQPTLQERLRRLTSPQREKLKKDLRGRLMGVLSERAKKLGLRPGSGGHGMGRVAQTSPSGKADAPMGARREVVRQLLKKNLGTEAVRAFWSAYRERAEDGRFLESALGVRSALERALVIADWEEGPVKHPVSLSELSKPEQHLLLKAVDDLPEDSLGKISAGTLENGETWLLTALRRYSEYRLIGMN